VVTALFADIVGFTGLAENRDPEDVKVLVDRCFEHLARDITSFGGVVDKVLGDGIVALFGAPTAHEDDAERAVRAGLRMQQTLAELAEDTDTVIRMRIGVNTGEVLVGTSTAGGDYTAMGDVMNSASRLEKLAEPGQVLAGVATKLATEDAIRYESVGRLAAKGREEPLEAWVAVEAIRPPGARRKTSGRFVGRKRELAILEAQGRLAFELHQAQLAFVIGESGMGKTRLVAEAYSRLARRFGAAVWHGRSVPYGEANVWWPIAEMIRDRFALALGTDEAEAEKVLRAELTERMPDRPASVIDRYSNALLHALGYATQLRGGDRARNRSEVTQAFTQVLETELARGPVVMAVSDIHFAGDAVWNLLHNGLTHLAHSPLLVLASANAVDRSAIFEGRHGTTMVRLGPLEDEAARELVESLGAALRAQPLPEPTIDALVSRSGGNPFFLEELTVLVAGQGTDGFGTPTGAGIGQSPRTSSIDSLGQLPNTLRGIVSARLDALSADERALLEDAAVLGRSGPVVGLRILAQESRGVSTIDDAITSLVTQDLVRIDGPRYEFRSDLVRDVAYGTLTKSARATRHADIARYLENAQSGSIRSSVLVAIADHYRAAARLGSELQAMDPGERAELMAKALHWLELAGNRALAAGEPADAERWFSSGLDLAADAATTATFLYGRARARCEIHDIAGARDDLRRLEEFVTHNPLLAAKALLVTGDVSRKAGDLTEAANELREAADRLAVLGATDHQSLALRLLGLTEMARSDDSLAVQAFESSREVAALAGDRRGEAWTLQSMAWLAFSQGRVHDANRLAAIAIEVFVELGDRSGLAWAQGVQAWVAFHLGQFNTAQELVESLLPDVRRRGDPWAESMMLILSASLALWSGQAARAAELCAEAVEMSRRSDDRGLEVQALAVQGRAYASLGRLADGSSALERAFALAEQRRDRYNRRIAVIANCASAARLGESERAMRWAAQFDGVHDPAVVGEADLIVSLAVALLARGAVDEAAGQLAWLDDHNGGDDRRAAFHAEAVRAILAAAQDRVDDVEQSVDRVLSGGSTYLDRITVLLAQAAARARGGDDEGCEQALSKAKGMLAGTDDRLTGWIVDLVAAVCGHGDLDAARARIANAGLDPTGLITMWTLAARQTSNR
jgi:class 3 adenylate cyclase/tetratricopeptide (TPR) repeat protein